MPSGNEHLQFARWSRLIRQRRITARCSQWQANCKCASEPTRVAQHLSSRDSVHIAQECQASTWKRNKSGSNLHYYPDRDLRIKLLIPTATIKRKRKTRVDDANN